MLAGLSFDYRQRAKVVSISILFFVLGKNKTPLNEKQNPFEWNGFRLCSVEFPSNHYISFQPYLNLDVEDNLFSFQVRLHYYKTSLWRVIKTEMNQCSWKDLD